MKELEITKFMVDTTQIITCRKGDLCAWIHNTGNIWNQQSCYQIADLHVFDDGCSLLITNRIEDVPDCVPIEPTLVAGKNNVRRMMEKLNNGYNPSNFFSDDLDEIWKLHMNDYLVWCGKRSSDLIEPLGLYRFDTGCLSIVQNVNYEKLIDDNTTSHSLDEALTSEMGNVITKVLNLIREQDPPRTLPSKWALG